MSQVSASPLPFPHFATYCFIYWLPWIGSPNVHSINFYLQYLTLNGSIYSTIFHTLHIQYYPQYTPYTVPSSIHSIYSTMLHILKLQYHHQQTPYKYHHQYTPTIISPSIDTIYIDILNNALTMTLLYYTDMWFIRTYKYII